MEHKIPRNIAVAGLALGFIFFCIGAVAPFWAYAVTYISQVGIVDVNAGLWWGCTHNTIIETTCDYIDISNDSGSIGAKYWVMRFTSIISVVFALGSAINAKRPTAKNVSNGVSAFIAAAAGIITLAIYASVIDHAKSSYTGSDTIRYDWAFYIYIAGTVIVGISAILVCFASSNDVSGQVISYGAQGNMVFMATTSQQQQQSYAGGPQYPNANPGYSWQQPQSGSNINYAYSAKQ